MRKLLKFFVIFLITLNSCNNHESTNKTTIDTLQIRVADTLFSQRTIQQKQKVVVDAKEVIAKLNAFMKKYETPSQTFEIASNKPIQVKGNKGTVIYINPKDLETTNGNPLEKIIKVELKELTNQTDFVYNNAQTVSDENHLISGGAYYINMTFGGQKLKIKEGKSLKVVFTKISKNEMSLFYGQRDSVGNMNWKQAKEKFTNKKVTKAEMQKRRKVSSYWGTYSLESGKSETGVNLDTMELSADEKNNMEAENAMYDKVYEAIDINKFGWINCDQIAMPGTAALAVNFNPNDSVSYAKLFLVFEDRNSVLSSFYIQGNKDYNGFFSGIPLGAKTRMIAYTVKDDKVFAYSSDITSRMGHIITPTLKEINEKDFKKLLKSN